MTCYYLGFDEETPIRLIHKLILRATFSQIIVERIEFQTDTFILGGFPYTLFSAYDAAKACLEGILQQEETDGPIPLFNGDICDDLFNKDKYKTPNLKIFQFTSGNVKEDLA